MQPDPAALDLPSGSLAGCEMRSDHSVKAHELENEVSMISKLCLEKSEVIRIKIKIRHHEMPVREPAVNTMAGEKRWANTHHVHSDQRGPGKTARAPPGRACPARTGTGLRGAEGPAPPSGERTNLHERVTAPQNAATKQRRRRRASRRRGGRTGDPERGLPTPLSVTDAAHGAKPGTTQRTEERCQPHGSR